jgi:hypothetical protein
MGSFLSKLAAAWSSIQAGDRAAIIIAIIAVMAVALVIYQTSLLIVQSDLMKRLSRIMERQHEILERQLAQRMEFDLTYELRHHTDDTFIIEFRVKNTGTKTANGFYWLILTPVKEFHELLRADVTAPVFGAVTHVEMDGVKYRETSIYRSEPLYPGRATTLAVSYLMKEKAKAPFHVWWQISSEGGLSPDGGAMGKITVAG